MNNLIPVTFTNGQLPVLPADIMQQMKQFMDDDFSDLGGGTMRFIRPRKSDFLLVDGGNQEVVYGHELFGVLICVAPTNHCVWYDREYAPGQEPSAPDLIWNQTAPDQFPDALPEMYRHKILRNGQERWGFQIRRRSVWALCRKDPNGQMMLDISRPFILDLTSMSLFGKSNPQQNAYKFAGLKDLCTQYSGNGFICTPSMFMTQIFLDPNVSVAGVVVFRPARDAQGNLSFLDAQTIQSVYAARTSQEVQDMRIVREKLDYTPDGSNSAFSAPAQLAAAPQPVAPVAPVAQPMPAPVTPMPSAIPAAPVAPVTPMPQPVAPAAPIPQPAVIPPLPPVTAEARPNRPEAMDSNGMNALLAQAQGILANGATGQQPAAVVSQPQPLPAQMPVMPQPLPVQGAEQPQPVMAGSESDLSGNFANILGALM